ncbi:S8 family serine peptidase [Gallaecimonas sp. GXIMD4217]|uniref:S8 family serine peptidase n=1 Tax=Gallaecimonas sp. GXIMD4217 TaxID=3131927 RepID=UPI00311AFF73
MFQNTFRLSLVAAACSALLACNSENNNVEAPAAEVPPPSQSIQATALGQQTAPIYTGQLIVKYQGQKGEGAPGDKALAAMEARLMDKASAAGLNLSKVRSLTKQIQLYKLENRDDVHKAVKALSDAEGVAYVEADRWMRPMMPPNDPQYNSQWHYFGATGMNVDNAWDSANGAGVVVSVIDSGIRPNHPDLANQLLPGYDFISHSWIANDGDGRDNDPTDAGDYLRAGECEQFYGQYYPQRDTPASWHGSHVAGTIAAETNNNVGVAGVAHGARVFAARALGRCGGSTADIVDAIRWSAGLAVAGTPANANPADVINMSLGGGGACGAAYQDAINDAVNAGAVVVVAAGNDNTNVSNASPANCNNVISVASTGRDGNRSWFSNYGNLIDIAAPGGSGDGVAANDIYSTVNSGQYAEGNESYGTMAGTSMAAPHVAGVAALMKGVNDQLTPAQIEQMIKDSARAFTSTDCTTANCGEGHLDAAAAVALAQGGNGTDPGTEPGGDVLSDGSVVSGIALAKGEKRVFTIEVPANAQNLSLNLAGPNGDADLWVKAGSEPSSSSDATWKSQGYNSNESVAISTPAAGTYYVVVYAYGAFDSASLTAGLTVSEPSSGGESVFENTNDVTITDNATASSTINVDRAGDSGTVLVSVDIKHSYRGDLRIKVFTPTGASATLQEPSNDSADNINKTWSLDAGTIPAAGEWRLTVEDVYSGDTGYIDSWKLEFQN